MKLDNRAVGNAIHVFNIVSVFAVVVMLPWMGKVDSVFVESGGAGFCGVVSSHVDATAEGSDQLFHVDATAEGSDQLYDVSLHYKSAALLWAGACVGTFLYYSKEKEEKSSPASLFLFWAVLGMIGHGIGHIGLAADTIAGVHPPPEHHLVDAMKRLDVGYVAAKLLPLQFILLFPNTKALSVTPTQKQASATTIFLICSAAAILASLVENAYAGGFLVGSFILTFSIRHLSMEDTSKRGPDYPLSAALLGTTFMVMQLFVEAEFCSSYQQFGGHNLSDAILVLSILGVHAIMNRTSKDQDVKRDQKKSY